jgi:ABC-2 type transport system permease protein
MKLWTNPLIQKELKERFRSPKSYWIVTLYLFVMGAIFFGFNYLESLNQMPFRPGSTEELIIALAVIQSGFIGFMTPALSAGVISGERERQTLPLLLTTHLSPGTIVFSKWLTSLAFILLMMLASLPLYAFVFLYGGLSPYQIVDLFLFFGVNVLFFGSIGLFCSTWIQRTGVATITAYGITFFVGVGTGLIAIFAHEWLRSLGYDPDKMLSLQLFMSINPGIILLEIMAGTNGPIDTESFSPWGIFALFYLTLSLILLWWSSYLLNPLRRWNKS